MSLKFNLKAGGTNQTLDPAKRGVITEGKTMVVGIDVTYPSRPLVLLVLSRALISFWVSVLSTSVCRSLERRWSLLWKACSSPASSIGRSITNLFRIASSSTEMGL
jgi:hypothetical protein